MKRIVLRTLFIFLLPLFLVGFVFRVGGVSFNLNLLNSQSTSTVQASLQNFAESLVGARNILDQTNLKEIVSLATYKVVLNNDVTVLKPQESMETTTTLRCSMGNETKDIPYHTDVILLSTEFSEIRNVLQTFHCDQIRWLPAGIAESASTLPVIKNGHLGMTISPTLGSITIAYSILLLGLFGLIPLLREVWKFLIKGRKYFSNE